MSLSSRRDWAAVRSEEHTSELQSPCNLVCRLLLEKKNLQLTLQGCGLVSLLHDVRQLVAEQLLSSFGPWVILPCAKDNIASDRVGTRLHAARRFGGARIRMDPDVAEVMPEARFHGGAGCR